MRRERPVPLVDGVVGDHGRHAELEAQVARVGEIAGIATELVLGDGEAGPDA